MMFTANTPVARVGLNFVGRKSSKREESGIIVLKQSVTTLGEATTSGLFDDIYVLHAQHETKRSPKIQPSNQNATK